MKGVAGVGVVVLGMVGVLASPVQAFPGGVKFRIESMQSKAKCVEVEVATGVLSLADCVRTSTPVEQLFSWDDSTDQIRSVAGGEDGLCAAAVKGSVQMVKCEAPSEAQRWSYTALRRIQGGDVQGKCWEAASSGIHKIGYKACPDKPKKTQVFMLAQVRAKPSFDKSSLAELLSKLPLDKLLGKH